jgi:hypothetical protein
MDSYPRDTETVPGGNGAITWGDIITTFDRWADPDLPRPWRLYIEGGSPAPAATAKARSAQTQTSGPTLEIYGGEALAGGTLRVPVWAELGSQSADRLAFAVETAPAQGAASAAEIIGFEAAPGLGEPTLMDLPQGRLAVAWFVPMDNIISGSTYLGELLIQLPADAQAGQCWQVHVASTGASLMEEELTPALTAGEDALVCAAAAGPHDVGVKLHAPKQARVGALCQLTVDLLNQTKTAEIVQLRLRRNGLLLDCWVLDLSGEKKLRLNIPYLASAADKPSVEIAVEAVIAADDNPKDNIAQSIIGIK